MLALLSTPEIHEANIYRAVKAGHVLLTELLIAKADGNIETEDGYTLLHQTSESGHVEGVKILIQAGVEVNNPRGRDGWTPLHLSSMKGHVEVVKRLIQAGGDSNCQTVSGYTPLHWASLYGHVEVITALLAGGADKTIENKGGRTPYDWAKNQDTENALE